MIKMLMILRCAQPGCVMGKMPNGSACSNCGGTGLDPDDYRAKTGDLVSDAAGISTNDPQPRFKTPEDAIAHARETYKQVLAEHGTTAEEVQAEERAMNEQRDPEDRAKHQQWMKDNPRIREQLDALEKEVVAHVYGALRKPEERVPLLSEPEYQRLSDGKNLDWALGFKQSSDFYEDLITKGELAVVKTVKRSEFKEHALNHCFDPDAMANALDSYFYTYLPFCPGCGAKIIEA